MFFYLQINVFIIYGFRAVINCIDLRQTTDHRSPVNSTHIVEYISPENMLRSGDICLQLSGRAACRVHVLV